MKNLAEFKRLLIPGSKWIFCFGDKKALRREVVQSLRSGVYFKGKSPMDGTFRTDIWFPLPKASECTFKDGGVTIQNKFYADMPLHYKLDTGEEIKNG